jgi:hypothetical protein
LSIFLALRRPEGRLFFWTRAVVEDMVRCVKDLCRPFRGSPVNRLHPGLTPRARSMPPFGLGHGEPVVSRELFVSRVNQSSRMRLLGWVDYLTTCPREFSASNGATPLATYSCSSNQALQSTIPLSPKGVTLRARRGSAGTRIKGSRAPEGRHIHSGSSPWSLNSARYSCSKVIFR